VSGQGLQSRAPSERPPLAARCRDRLQAMREAGVSMPILVPSTVKEDFGSMVAKTREAFAGN
jgi:hypothetical protein